MRDRLSQAIRERGPFRRFRGVLADDRRLEREWQAYERRRQRETIVEWLGSVGVEPTNRDDRTFAPPLPDLRKIMFAEVRRFVRFARDLPGVARIAMIGSLTTEKEFPKDIDMLVNGSNYKKDKLYPTVARAVAEIMKTEDVIGTVDVLMRMNRIDKKGLRRLAFRPHSLSGKSLSREPGQGESDSTHPLATRRVVAACSIADGVSEMG